MSLDLLSQTFLRNTITDYLLAIATLFLGIVLVNIVRTVILRYVKRWAQKSATDLDDRLLSLIEKPIIYLLYLGSFYVSIGNLSLHPILRESINVLCVILTTVLVVQLVSSLVEYALRIYWLTRSRGAALEQSLNALIPAIRVVLWAIGLVFLLDNLGFDISAVIASLGIGGVAVALASQSVLADLFSYFSILFDRPFEIGDFLIVGDMVGTVEHVGIKTTRLRSISGEELIASNTDLTSSRIQNFRRMRRRRIVFKLGITYETPQNTVETVPGIIQTVVEGVEGVTFDRAHFLSFGDFSLDYEVVYFVETSDYNAYMNAQQHINLGIRAAFDARGIEFAYPTRSLYVNAADDEAAIAPNPDHSHEQSLPTDQPMEDSPVTPT